MLAFRLIRLLAVLVLPAMAAVQAAPAAAADDPPESTRYRLVYLEEAPLILELDILIELKSVAEQRRLASESVVRAADRDGDAKLSVAEAAEGAPLPSGDVPLPTLWAAADTDGDDRLDAAEFVTVLDRLVGPPVQVRFEQPRAFSSLSLESLLDLNRDKMVEPDEWEAGWKRLFRVDFDDDDTLSAAELVTFIDPATDSDNRLPSFVTEDDPKLAATIRTLAERSRTDRSWAGRRWAELGPIDRPLTDEAIDQWVRTGPADLIAKVRVSTQRKNYVLVEPGPARLRLGRVSRQRRQTAVQAQLARSEMEFRTNKSGYAAADSRAFLLTQARTADIDQSGSVTRDEYRLIDGVLPGDFGTIDADGDGVLTFEEIGQRIDATQRFAQLRVKLTIANVAENLFEKLDADSDRRLGPRELTRIGASRRIDLRRLESKYRLTAETDVINLIPREEMAMDEQQVGIIRDRDEGPVWFQRMDRNRDGDVSWREFLGPREAFDKLDADADGLIDPDEAAAARP